MIKTGNVISVQELPVLGNMQYRKGVQVTDTLLHFEDTYSLSERLTLNNVQEAARLASMEDRC